MKPVVKPPVIAPEGQIWPPAPGNPTIVLGLGTTDVERRLITAQVAAFDEQGQLTFDAREAVDRARAGDAAITPVAVAWLPKRRDDAGRPAFADLFRLADELSPQLQKRILAREPERSRIVVGAPARRSELAERYRHHSGDGDTDAGFASYVARQARLAVDRTERGLLGARYKTARTVVEDLAESRRFKDGARELASSLGRPFDAVAAEARADLDEMSTIQTRAAQDVWAHWARFLWSRAYQLEVDVAGLERVRELNRETPCVFLPSHKSNLDGYVFSSVLHDHGFPQNHVLGGINMAFWPIGALGRKVGVIWIRRSFGGDEVYKFALRRYLAHLASKRFNLEWYIEGGRSRTGKLLPPKMGLLNYLARGVEETDVQEVYLVPVSIVYDRLNEVIEMTAESRGATKKPEGLSWLLRYARMQRGGMGRIQVRFGEPVALRAALAEADSGDEAARKLALSKAAFEVCTRINRATPVTPTSLATLALLGAEGRAVTLEEVRTAIAPLRRYVLQRGLPGLEEIEPLDRSDAVRDVLATLVEHGVVEVYSGGTDAVYRIGPDRELAAAFYRNMDIHWFVKRAIVELGLVAASETPEADPLEVGLEQAFRLRDLLKFEFFFAEKTEFQDELRAEMELIDPDWRQRGETLAAALTASGALIAHRVLRSFIEAYAIVSDRLVALGTEAADEAELVERSLAVGRQHQLQGRVASAEAISTEFFKTGIKLAGNRGLLHEGPEVGEGRRRFQIELHHVLHGLDVVREWANQEAAG